MKDPEQLRVWYSLDASRDVDVLVSWRGKLIPLNHD